MIRLLRPLREPLGTPLMMPHHQLEKRILDHWGAKDSRSSFCKIRVQICRANTHEMRMRWIFSSAWSQSGHAGGWGSPRLARRSAVQHQLLMDNQTKNLHHKGAQLLQICFQGANLMLPRKKALYADQLLYVPVILGFHKILCTSIIKNELLWVQHCHCIIKSFESHTNKSNAISFKCWDRLLMPLLPQNFTRCL